MVWPLPIVVFIYVAGIYRGTSYDRKEFDVKPLDVVPVMENFSFEVELFILHGHTYR